MADPSELLILEEPSPACMDFSANKSVSNRESQTVTDTRSLSLTVEEKTERGDKNLLLLDFDEPRQVASESFDVSHFRKSGEEKASDESNAKKSRTESLMPGSLIGTMNDVDQLLYKSIGDNNHVNLSGFLA